ncbi:substrate-binding and VWA domain-containing protein [Nocardiopsis lambiniae]|uniref:Substrate-binding and VWA domain-containing protein n=1 Tax=Nocardiopsis lambiniae TaxID=3075539 RepID=A0ABU2M4F8_9ACTN|nr:substrate-binding and VWA domain-containing protein [Nocardiopsis sp. DSM 44743]MDT0327539.1 substrate-binding and VWA domain-containing protein [Nocardiopsis sp. DSM 44743]
MGRHRGRYAEEPSGRSRRRRGRGGAFAALAAALVIVVGLAGVGVYMFGNSDGCGGSDIQLDVAASPELAPAVDAVARDFNLTETAVDGRCVHVEVRQVDSANVAFGITGAGATMGDTDSDVWIPDSSVWPRLVQSQSGDAVITDTGTSVARTPLVVTELAAYAAEGDEPTTWMDVVPTTAPGEQAEHTVRVVDPARSSTGLGTLYLLHGALKEASPDNDTFNATMTAALQALHRGASADEEAAFLALSGGGEEAPPIMVMSEQAAWRYNTAHSDTSVRVDYLEDGTYYLDYPYIVRTEDGEITRAAEAFRTAIRSDEARQHILAEGFRGPDDEVDTSLLAAEHGFQETAPEELPAPSEGSITDLTLTWNQMKMDSRVLAIVDVSGSMLAEVPGTGMTRMQVTGAAATQGLEMFSPSSELGLWKFSTDVNNNLHYQEVAPVRELQAAADDGTEQREILAGSLASLQPLPQGDTALYETYLAAYQEMSRTYRPDRNNVILMLTDGDNDNPGGMELDELLSQIDAIASPARPIPIITIAFGPDVQNLEPLQQIAAATGGAAYMTEDPTEIGDIFIRAFSLRISDPEE